ncbi:ABC-2 family transporter protein [Jeotgalicoccus saudimassiliensis]|uniref:ABC-2 family transporter protein n=1 Tax=Jeotgalicoccus saudimassiliensis TaxID=1461582 RepID=A0A078M7U1_9STAP|nr:ABC transporter permease [Jeotgalicoccus saudimassiliensis]CEA03498.1 ABC-2 family transporter protein [Jeotgalicoccus saudimassiliensis]
MTIFKIILLHFWKFKWMIIPLALIFFVIAALFSTAGGGKETFESKTLSITVVNNSDSDTSDALLEYLSSSHEVEVMTGSDSEHLKEQVFLMEIHGAVIIEENFEELVKNGEPAVEVITDERAASAVQLETEISKFLMFANAQFNDTGSLDTETLQSALTDTVNVELNNGTVVNSGENYENAAAYTNFAAYWLMLFIMLSIGNLMSEYNKPELQKRIISAPVSSTANALQVLGAQSLVGIFAVLVMFFGLIGLYYDRLEGIPLPHIFVALILIMVFTLALQYAINALTTNRFIVNGLANLVTLGLAFLSGIFIPIELFGDSAQRIAEFLPLYHFTQIYAAPDITWSQAALPIGILILYTVAFLIIGIIFSNQRKSTQL